MHVSLSELEATVTKAASGIGIPLGLGQDTARAARWLASHGYDPIPALVGALDATDRGKAGNFKADQAIRGIFKPDGASERLSSLRAGPSACDLLLAAAHDTVNLEAIDSTAVVLMLACAASRETAGAWRLTWRDAAGEAFEAVCQDGRFHGRQGDAAILSSPGPAAVSLNVTERQTLERTSAPCDARKEGAEVDEGAWRRLAAFADRCLVEATEASRLTGAGAGVVDTD